MEGLTLPYTLRGNHLDLNTIEKCLEYVVLVKLIGVNNSLKVVKIIGSKYFPLELYQAAHPPPPCLAPPAYTTSTVKLGLAKTKSKCSSIL